MSSAHDNLIDGKGVVAALGGNAIIGKYEEGDIHKQFANTRRSLGGIAQMIKDGYRTVITHGNGPQVGNELIRVEMSRDMVPPLPLGVLVGDTEGGMGYMVEQCLQNMLHETGVNDKQIATLVTQVLVDKDDPSITSPTKFVGPFINRKDIRTFAGERGWIIKKDPGRGYRRVVPSPKPLEIVNRQAIKLLLDNNFVVIAAGGGGIPAYIDERGWYEGVDAVIDKDFASAVLAKDIGAKLLIFLTGVDKVALNFRRPQEKFLDSMTISEARKYYQQGHFPKGSMGPKVLAAVEFLEQGGEDVIITSSKLATNALKGKSGTRITKK